MLFPIQTGKKSKALCSLKSSPYQGTEKGHPLIWVIISQGQNVPSALCSHLCDCYLPFASGSSLGYSLYSTFAAVSIKLVENRLK